MICDPVIIKSGGSPMHQITNQQTTCTFPDSAQAGEIVTSDIVMETRPPSIIVRTTDGGSIPCGTTGDIMSGFAAIFVMPASDVIITKGSIVPEIT